MKPRILLAVDGSETSKKAVGHVGQIASTSDIVLYHVIQPPPRLFEKGCQEDGLEEEHEAWLKEARRKVDAEIFEPSKAVLAAHGVNGDAVKCVLAEDAHPDTAVDILQEAEDGGYCAVVIGRRGHSRLTEFLFGSVATKVVNHAKNCAVWVVE